LSQPKETFCPEAETKKNPVRQEYAMLVIGELINSTRKRVKDAIKNKDEATIRHLARIQIEAGADVLDVNTAASMQREIEDMRWIIGLIQDEMSGVRLCIDSPNPQAIATGLALCKARPVINSISNEHGKEPLIELLVQNDVDVIGLAMGEHGMPKTAEDRLSEARALVDKCQKAGIRTERIYVDMMCMSVGSNSEQGVLVLEAVRRARSDLGVKTIVGVSNISFGLPNRRLLNHTYLGMLLAAGVDAVIMDPTDAGIMDTIYVSNALLGTDKYCKEYLKCQRKPR